MCDPVSLGTAALVTAYTVDRSMKIQKSAFEDALASSQLPPKPPQAASLPDESARRAAQAVALVSGRQGGTLLTGPSGVSSGGLNLGRNTLLGS